jgi:predicted metal-dependent phosphoesterase TrpH
MVDRHSHTDCSDGILSPDHLVDLARLGGLQALAITDHDTIEGYDLAEGYARGLGFDLICGVELSTKFHDRAIHILGYFLEKPPDASFRSHLSCLQQARRERNIRLAGRLRRLGLSITLEEAEKLGRSQTGRPHFAQVLVKKGYVANMREAFDRYLDESAAAFVERKDASPDNVLSWIREAGGISSWAHPGRFLREAALPVEQLFAELASHGLNAIEVYHTDHFPEESEVFRKLAQGLGLGITGGSDFHGGSSSRAQLGSLKLPSSLLEELREFSRRLAAGNA